MLAFSKLHQIRVIIVLWNLVQMIQYIFRVFITYLQKQRQHQQLQHQQLRPARWSSGTYH